MDYLTELEVCVDAIIEIAVLKKNKLQYCEPHMNKAINYTYTFLLSVLVFVLILDLYMFTQNPQDYKYSSATWSGYFIKSIGTISIYSFLLAISIVRLRNSKNRIINVLYYTGLIFFACTIIYNIYDWVSTGG